MSQRKSIGQRFSFNMEDTEYPCVCRRSFSCSDEIKCGIHDSGYSDCLLDDMAELQFGSGS